MDIPVFPDDTEPKVLQGISMPNEWMPWLGGILYDQGGNPIPFFVSIKSSYGNGILFIGGQEYTLAFDYGYSSYVNGVLTLGSMPQIRIDYKLPHHVTIYIRSDLILDLTCTLRGPPLWYSKSTNQADLLQLTDTSYLGGYDACVRLSGILQSGARSVTVNGFGIWEHTWIRGQWDASKHPRLWMFINDENFYGTLLISRSYSTGKTLVYTGRLGREGVETYTWDEVQWRDDETQRPKYINLVGQYRDVNGIVRGVADIKTDSAKSWYLFNSVWTEHPVVTGTIDSILFNGTGWSEVLKVGVVSPPPEGDLALFFLAIGVGGLAGLGLYYLLRAK